jgi:hypothetical protein
MSLAKHAPFGTLDLVRYYEFSVCAIFGPHCKRLQRASDLCHHGWPSPDKVSILDAGSRQADKIFTNTFRPEWHASFASNVASADPYQL